MKDSVLKKFEKIKQTRELSKDNKKYIFGRILANSVICIAIFVLILIFKVAACYLTKTTAKIVYDVYSIIFLIFALILLEIVYKKDSSKWMASGLEILILALFTLFSTNIVLKNQNNVINIIILVITIYYNTKIIYIYTTERGKILLASSDIPEIIKKESQDEMAQEFKQKDVKKIKTKTRRRKK